MAYSEKVVDHFNNPRNMGSFKKDEPGVGTGIVGAPECGDVMKLQIKVEDGTIVLRTGGGGFGKKEERKEVTLKVGKSVKVVGLVFRGIPNSPADLVRIPALRQVLHPFTPIDAMEFTLKHMRPTKGNVEFLGGRQATRPPRRRGAERADDDQQRDRGRDGGRRAGPLFG